MLLLSRATFLLALPSFANLAVAGDWFLLDSKCQDDDLAGIENNPNSWAESGSIPTCIANGGDSSSILRNGGCGMKSWSGGDCRGESTA
jgi:hypothetical protein